MNSRRDFLKTIGASTIFLIAQKSFLSKALADSKSYKNQLPSLPPTNRDSLVLVEGLKQDLLIKWDDPISKKEKFGINNDFISMIEIPNKKNEFIMWVNHEYPMPYLQHGKSENKTLDDVNRERKSIGGSLIHIKKTSRSWDFIKDSKLNRRIDATTPIPFSNNESIMGKNIAIGTLANCAGGKTPWNTFLSCEENYSDYYKDNKYEWTKYFQEPDEHYGWVVEINPFENKNQKLVSLGRFEHEGATLTLAKDSRPVVYMGDDSADEHIYKFISDKKDSLTSGTLYVANLEKGKWEELSLKNSKLRKEFSSLTELLIYTRKAAKIVGATPLDRPEDIEVLNDGTVLVACTNNIARGRPHGYILSINEENNDPLSLNFTSSRWLEGGDDSGLSCPDNFAIDNNGHLWVTSDISEKFVNASPYEKRKNNGLFYIPTHGPLKGVVHQFASAPNDAEFTGPCFSPDFKTLFICVQHPGARSGPSGYTSHWPNKGDKPRSAIVALSGPLLDKLSHSK